MDWRELSRTNNEKWAQKQNAAYRERLQNIIYIVQRNQEFIASGTDCMTSHITEQNKN